MADENFQSIATQSRGRREEHRELGICLERHGLTKDMFAPGCDQLEQELPKMFSNMSISY